MIFRLSAGLHQPDMVAIRRGTGGATQRASTSLLGNFDTVWSGLLARPPEGEEVLPGARYNPCLAFCPPRSSSPYPTQYGLSPATLAVFLLSLILGVIRKRSNTTVYPGSRGIQFHPGLLSLLAVHPAPFAR